MAEDSRYWVYVIRLKRSAWDRSPKYRQANPDYQPGRPHVYVGSTSKAPEQRFAEHMAGGKTSSPFVRRFGKLLFNRAYEGQPEYRVRDSAERAEAALAEELRRRGWGVWCNARPLSERLGR
jgi:hypothetical protein